MTRCTRWEVTEYGPLPPCQCGACPPMSEAGERVCTSCAALRAERDILKERGDLRKAERDSLAARNAELEAALERIAQDSDPAGNLSEIARAALNLNKGPRS